MLAQMQMLRTCEQQPHDCDVLVFASDATVATVLKEFLAKHGIRASIACNPSVAMEIATMERPAVILMDCAYIGTRAAESFMGTLHESEASSEVIVMVGSDRESMVAQNFGACWMLRKPFRPNELMAMIDHALAANCGTAGEF